MICARTALWLSPYVSFLACEMAVTTIGHLRVKSDKCMWDAWITVNAL